MRVLVVDDYPGAAEISCMLLEILGHEAVTCSRARTRSRAPRELLPDVVILDIGLPDLSGYEVARRLRASPHGQDIYIAALTGWGEPADRARATAAGIDQHVTKPASVDKLRELLAAASHRGHAEHHEHRT